LRKQDKGRRDSRKSRRILGNPTEYPSRGGGILRQQARRPAAPTRGEFDADSELVARADNLPGRRSSRSRLGVACVSSAAAERPTDCASEGARWRSTCRVSAAHAAPRCAVDRSGRKPFRNDLVTRAAAQGPVRLKVEQLANCSAGTCVESRGPLWPTRIGMGQGFVNDSSRLQKNGPPLSCFRIILLSTQSSGRSFASVPEVGPPFTAVQIQRSSGRLDGCVRSAAEDPPRRSRCRRSGLATISRRARSALRPRSRSCGRASASGTGTHRLGPPSREFSSARGAPARHASRA